MREMLMNLRVQTRPALWLPLILLAAALTATFLTANSGEPVGLSPFARAGWLMSGVNNNEKSPYGDYRWSDGNAQLCIEQLGRIERAVLELTVIGEYTAGIGVDRFSLTAGNAAPVVVGTAGPLRRYRLLSGSDRQPDGRFCLTAVSAAVPDPNNPRDLGVALGLYRVTPLLTAPIVPAWPVTATVFAYLVVAVGLLHAVGIRLRSALAAVLTLTAGIVLFLNAGHVPAGPAALRWALPTLVGAGLTLTGVLIYRLPQLPPWGRSLPALSFGWLAVLTATHVSMQWVSGHSGVWPLKAQFFPQPYWGLVPLLVPYAGLIALAVRRLESPPRLRVLLPLTYLATLSLVVGMELVAEGPAGLTALFAESPYEYIRDVGLVGGDPIGFLRNFEQLAPDLALHASTHPPGSVLFFWLIEQLFGLGFLIPSLITVVLSSSAPLAAVWLANELSGRRAALIAALTAATMPGTLTYAVPSLDGVMNVLLAFGAAAFLLALLRPERWWYGLISGGFLALGLALTYAATQIFFFGVGAVLAVAVQLLRSGQSPRLVLLQIARGAVPAALVIVVASLATYLISGFNVVHAATTATRINAEMMDRFREVGMPALPFGPPSLDWYLRFAAANLLPFAWYVTPWLLALLSLQIAAARERRWSAPRDTLLAATAALVLGLWLGGLFNREVERIWAFAYPLIAATAALTVVEMPQARRVVSVFALLGLLSAAGVKALLNTFW
jgi:hypothetical protein